MVMDMEKWRGIGEANKLPELRNVRFEVPRSEVFR